MSLTSKGNKVMKKMREHYGSKKKAESVFYSMINEGKLKGAEKSKAKKRSKKK